VFTVIDAEGHGAKLSIKMTSDGGEWVEWNEGHAAPDAPPGF